jgi:hypothetical protein
MTTHLKTDRRYLTTAIPAVVGCVAALCAAPAMAQTKVVMIEEHWELNVADPDSASSAPQTSMVMSPTGDSNDVFFIFALNHQSAPGYEPGGLQVQHWDGADFVDARNSHEHGLLHHTDEVVTWVQRLELNEGHLTFGIYDGASESWGSFGGNDLKLSTSSSLTSLNAYRPAVSLGESQVGFAENRVNSLVLKKLVWKTDDGQVYEQNAPIPIDTSFE